MSQIPGEPQLDSPSWGEPTVTVRESPVTHRRPTSTTMQGWAYFGAVIMVLLGAFQAIEGLIALVDKEYFTLRENSLLAFSSYATWGWAHLIVGVLAVVAGAGIVLRGRRWARVTGIV